MWPSIARVSEQLDLWLQLADIPQPQSATLGLRPIAVSYYSFTYYSFTNLLTLNLENLKKTFNT